MFVWFELVWVGSVGYHVPPQLSNFLSSTYYKGGRRRPREGKGGERANASDEREDFYMTGPMMTDPDQTFERGGSPRPGIVNDTGLAQGILCSPRKITVWGLVHGLLL